MAGLGNAAMPAPADDPTAGAGADSGSQEGTPASPKEEAAAEQFMTLLVGMIYPQDNGKVQVFPQIIADLKGQFQPEALKLFQGIDPPLTDSPDDCVSATAVLLTWVVDQKMGLLDQAIAIGNQQGQPAAQQGDPGAAAPMQPGSGTPMPAQPQGAPPSAPQQPMGAGQPAMPEQEPDPNDPNEAGEGAEPAPGADDFDPEAVVMACGHEAVNVLARLSGQLGLKKFTEEDTTHAFYRALDLFRWSAQGMKPAIVEALKHGFKQLVSANQSGDLNKVLPGLPGGGDDPSPSSQGAPAPAQQGA